MTTWNRVAGDVNDTLIVQLDGVSNLVSATSAEAHVVAAGGTSATTLSAAVTDTSNNLVTVQLGTWLSATATAGPYDLETQVTFAGGVVLTWPEDSKDRINVRGAIA